MTESPAHASTGFRSIFKETIIYGFGSIATKATAFVLFPLYSLNFSVAEYGVMVRVEVFWQYIWAIINFGTTIALFKALAEQSVEHQRKVISSVFFFFLCLSALFAVVLLPWRGQVSHLLFGSEAYAPILTSAFFIALSEALLFIPLVVARNQHRPWRYVFLTLTNTLLVMGAQVYVLFAMEDKFANIYRVRALAPLIVLTIGLWSLRRHLSVVSIDFRKLLEIIRFSFPIMVAGVLSISLSNLDRYILAAFSTSDVVGLYGLGYTLAGLLNVFLIGPFLLVFNATVWQKIESDRNPRQWISTTLTYAFLVFMFGGLVISLFIPDFIRMFALRQEYWAAASVVPLLVVSYVFYGTANIGLISFYAVRKTLNILGLFLAATAINICLNVLLIPIAGAYGSAMAALLSFLAHTLLIYHGSKGKYFFAYEFRRGFKILGAAGIIFGITLIIHIDGLLAGTLFKIALLASFPFLLLLMQFYRPSEIDWIRNIVSRYVVRRIPPR